MQRNDAKTAWRTPEIEENSNLYLIHPASAYLVPKFARWGLSPNMVSLLGMLSALMGAYCFYHYTNTWMTLGGLVFMLGWHILDGADGQLARVTGQTSETGRVIDGLCDHLGFGMVYVAIAMALQPVYGPWIWLLAVVAGISHGVQASALEFHRDSYDCWVHRKTGKCVPPRLRGCPDQRESQSLFQAAADFYMQLQYRVAGYDHALVNGERKLRNHPEREAISQSYMTHGLAAVQRWTWLSANKRTLAVTICCLIKLPVLFFIYEIFVLNVFLLWLHQRQLHTNAALRSEILDRYDSTQAA